MKKVNLITSCAIAFTLLFTACTVEKRHYTKGYNVNWNKSMPKAEEMAKGNTTAPVEVASKQSIVLDQSKSTEAIKSIAMPTIAATAAVKHNATKKETPITTSSTKAPKKTAAAKYDSRESARMLVKGISNTKGGGKSQLVALLLCIFLGYIGIHRFYLGYIGIGILQIITAGGCGIWALIDLIRIITGDLGPANGSYTDTF